MEQDITACTLNEFLLNIYKCKIPFNLFVIDRSPKTVNGSYISSKHRIRVYTKCRDICDIKRTAIHEYAHHIHETEQGGIHGRGRFRAHGEIFWRIYSALMAEALIKGLFTDSCIYNIISGQDSFIDNNIK